MKLKSNFFFIFSSNFKNWLKINTPPKLRFFKAMVAQNLQPIGFNLIFDNLASIPKCLVRTLLPKMVELNANIIM